jgi:DnaJ-domain-containing protein 1
MKTKEYLSKYNLSNTIKFNHADFVEDLNFDFINALTISKGYEVYKGFVAAIRTIKEKFDSISNKSKEPIPDKLWKYFFATKIAPVREQFHQEAFNKDIAEKERERKSREEWREFRRKEDEDLSKEFFGAWRLFVDHSFESDFLHNFVKHLLDGVRNVADEKEKALRVLNLDTNATRDEVLINFRRLAHEHHPDKKGDPNKFMEILAAKNKCLEIFELEKQS